LSILKNINNNLLQTFDYEVQNGYNAIMKDLICYFSGTGNSLAIAKKVNEALDKSELFSITEESFLSPIQEKNYAKIAIIFPSYAYGLPKLVKQFLSRFPFRAPYIALVVSCGSSPGGTLHSAKRILKRQNISSSYHLEIQTVENFIPIFGEQPPEKIAKRLTNQEVKTRELIAAIKAEKQNKLKGIKPISAIVSHIFLAASPLLAKCIKVNKNCTKCEHCIKICPTNALFLNKKGKIKIKARRCNLCQACLNLCPQNALTLARLKKKTKKYHHPDISGKEFLKR